jgi:hypothetical protein
VTIVKENSVSNATIHPKMDYYNPSVIIIIITYAVMLMRLTCTLVVLNRSLLGISFSSAQFLAIAGFAPTPLYE